MDEFRRRYDVPRRDYGMPAGRPPTPIPDSQPQTPAPAPVEPPSPSHHQPHHSPAPHHQTAVHRSSTQPIDDLRPPTQRYTPPPAHNQPTPHRQPSVISRLKAHKYFKLAVAATAVLLLVVAFLALKPAPRPKEVLPADLAKKANFSVYYPSSTPGGFTYDKTLATFTNNQAYFLLNKGTEHVVVREQTWSSSKLDASSITGAEDLPTPVGKAAIGTNSGQTAAVVLAKTTLINITSNGSVPREEMIAIINNLKNISPN